MQQQSIGASWLYSVDVPHCQKELDVELHKRALETWGKNKIPSSDVKRRNIDLQLN